MLQPARGRLGQGGLEGSLHQTSVEVTPSQGPHGTNAAAWDPGEKHHGRWKLRTWPLWKDRTNRRLVSFLKIMTVT